MRAWVAAVVVLGGCETVNNYYVNGAVDGGADTLLGTDASGGSGGTGGNGGSAGTGGSGGSAGTGGSGGSAGASAWAPLTVANGTGNTRIALPASDGYGLTLDAQNIYFVAAGLNGEAGTQIVRLPISGGQATYLQAPETRTGGRLAAGAGYLYWAEASRGEKISLENGSFRLIWGSLTGVGGPNTGINSYTIAVDDQSAYFTDWGTVGPRGSYCTGRVYYAPLDGSNPAGVVLAQNRCNPSSVAIDAGNVYWGEYYGATVWKVSKSGGTAEMLAGPSNREILNIATDGSKIFFTDRFSLQAVSISGGGPSILSSPPSGSGFLSAVQADATKVFWWQGNSDMSAGTISSAAKDGSNASPITPTYGSRAKFFEFVVSAAEAFWIESSNGTVSIKKAAR